MDTTQNTTETKVASPRGDAVRTSKEEVLAEVPVSVTKEKPKKSWTPAFKKNQEVFFTVFLKEDKNTFYVCKGLVQDIPGPNERQAYRIRIIAIGNRPVGGKPVIRQARLLGLVVTKRTREVARYLNPFMTPKIWIDKVPDDLKEQNVRSNSRNQTYGKTKKKRPATPSNGKKVQSRGHSPSTSKKN